MARVSTHAIKQASLNLKDMVDKKPLGLEIQDLLEDSLLRTSGNLNVNGVRTWGKEDHKPEIVQTAIDQIKALFNVGTEVKSWTASYYPAESNVKNEEVNIQPGEKGLGGRFIIVIGSREIANLALSMGSTEAENPMMMLSGDCLHLKITICPVLNVIFKNIPAEKMAARKGFREMVIRKNWNTRHILVIESHVEMSDVVSHVSKKLLGKGKTDSSSSEVDAVAEAASTTD